MGGSEFGMMKPGETDWVHGLHWREGDAKGPKASQEISTT